MNGYRWFMVFISIVMFSQNVCFAQITKEEVISNFVGAGLAYKDGQYAQAINQYEAILASGFESGAVYYNLGNSYFKEGNIGKAVLNFERARRFLPRDSDLLFNERYVNNRVDQYGELDSKGIMQRLLQKHIEFYTLDEMALIVYLISAIGGVLYLIALFTGWSRNALAFVAAVVFTGIVIFGGGMYAKMRYEQSLAIVMQTTETYFEPREDSTVHFKLAQGAHARILKTEGLWVKIQRLDGKEGWIRKNVLENI